MISKYINFKNNVNYDEIKLPAQAIRDGKLVLFPTETVYGIGANALDTEAVKKIYIAKGRASDNPLIAHISDIKMLDDLVLEVGDVEKKLIEKFWPGPLTVVFRKKTIVPDIITGGLDTVAIRMPSNEIARKLIEFSGVPIAAPSANISGKPSGTLIEDIIEELDGKVEYVIDNGKVDIGVESTVIRVIDGVVHILRPGKITPEDIEKMGIPVYIEKQILGEYKEGEKVMSPGIKYKHYAPNTKCILVYSENNEKMVEKINELSSGKNVTVLCKTSNLEKYNVQNKLDLGDTLEEISSNIFTLLRKADRLNSELILIEGVEKTGLGLAIMNRLIRASAHEYIEIAPTT